MSKKLISDSILTAIANAIRTKRGTSVQYKPSEMANAILSIPTGGGGGITPAGTLAITENNKVYDCYQYAEASVQIPSPTDVLEITENGTYGVNGYGSVEVDVAQGSTPEGIFYAVRNGSYDIRNYATVVVNVNQPAESAPYSLQKKDYILVDSYGRIKYGYTAEEILALGALPTGYAWNYTLADLTALANAGCPAVVGTKFSSADSILFFAGVSLTSEQTITITVTLNNFTGTIGYNEIISDDPTVIPPAGDSDSYKGHTGEVDITIKVGNNYDQKVTISGIEGSFAFGSEDGGSIFKANETLGKQLLMEVQVGKYCSRVYARSFQNCTNLQSVTFSSDNLTGGLILGEWAFSGCQRIKQLSIPNSLNLAEMAQNASKPFSNAGLDFISFDPTMTGIENIIDSSGRVPILKASLPIGVTSIAGGTFELLAGQSKLVLPPSVSEISTPYAFGLNELVIKNTSAVVNLVSDPYYALQNVLIKVPSSKLAEYKNATNWSFYASNIVADV